MPITGKPRDFYDKFKFLIEIDNVRYAGFQKCSELSMELETIEHREGGGLVAHKSPGTLSVPDLTLERGATDDLDIYNWFQLAVSAAAGLGGVGLSGAGYKRDLDIVALNRDDTERRRWQVTGAWPKKFTAGDWDSGASEKLIEKVVLVYDFFTVKT
jgi:phage tail-like protein